MFRVAAGDPANPLDFLSFAVVMDGRDRTAGFRLTGGEAWGSLAGPPSDGHAAELIAAGAHEVTGRICSLRGICGSTSATVTVTPPLTPIDGSPAGASPPPKSRGLPGALSGAIRWVIGA